MNWVHMLLGIGMIVSGFTIARYSLKCSVKRGVPQLISGIVLLTCGVYVAIHSVV